MSEMADRRRSRGANYRQEGSRTHSRSKNGRPPTGTWQPAVPQWEKNFCYRVGLIPWGRIVETSKVMDYYPNVVEWNASAVEETFNNEKSRFWAAINGLHCDIPLPDPDMFIDDIDWDSDHVDPELLLELDQDRLGSEEGEKTDHGNLGLTADILFLMNQPVPCTGWGDEEEDPPRTANNTLSGPGLEGNGGENNINESEHSRSTRNGGNLGTWNSNRRKGGGAGGYRTRFRKSKPLVPKQWNSINNCGPISYNRSDAAGRWGYEKTLSLQ